MKRASLLQCTAAGLLAFGVLFTLLSPLLAQEPVRIIWLHHSCGQNLIEQGGIRQGLTALGYEFYDHGYNGEGLRLADGSYAGRNFDVPGDNTDPDGLAEIFSQPLHDPPDNAFSHLMQYDVIAFKSCFPTSNIASDAQLAEYQSYYLSIRSRMAQYPDKLFVVVTQPPQVPGASNRDEARRARALADWLSSDEFLAGQSNVVTFDFFDHLAGDDGFLRPEYRFDDYDAHPNERANRDIGPRFVEFLDRAIQGFEPANRGQPPTARPTVTPEAVVVEATEAPPPPTTAPPPPTTAPAAYQGLDLGRWSASTDDHSTATCAPEGSGALRFDYQLGAEGWAFCGPSFDAPLDCSAAPGLSFRLRADPPDRPVILTLFAGDPQAPAPYELRLDAPAEWTTFTIPWTDFVLAPWAAADDPAQPDTARVVGLGLSLESGGGEEEGALWIGDVALADEVSEPAAPAVPATDSAASAPSATPEATAEGGGGLCASVGILPLGIAAVLVARRGRKEEG